MESIQDHKRNYIILFWLLKTVIISGCLAVIADNIVILINGIERLALYIPMWRRILIDCLFPVLCFIWSGINLNKKLAEYDRLIAIKRKEREKDKMRRENQSVINRRKEPVDYLEEQAEAFRIAVINGSSTENIDWDYLDGENKEKFTKELATLSGLDETQYQRTILYVWDKLVSIYNGIQEYIEGLGEQRSKEYCLMLQIEQEVFSYISAAYYHSVFKEPNFCHRSILQKIEKEIKGNGGTDLIRKSADYCGISESLMLRFRNDQCVKCKMRGCIGRVDETHGILELVGPHCDDTIFKEDDEYQIQEELIPVKGDALEHFKTKYGEDYAERYVRALIAMMGYYPDMTFRELKEPWDWCKETYSMSFDFDWPIKLEESLIALIFDKIKQVKDEEKELEAVVFSLISPFDKICHSLFPKPNDRMYVEGAIALQNYSRYDGSPSLDKFKEKWALSIDETRKILKEQNLSNIEYLWVLNYAIQEKKGISPFIFGNLDTRKINDIYFELHFYATIIEAALLRYGIRRDIFSYMRDSNVFLTDFIDESEIGAVMDMNDSQVSTLVARYGHTLSATSDDVFSIAIENFESDREIDTSSISKSEFNQKIHEMVGHIPGGLVISKEAADEGNNVADEQNNPNVNHSDTGVGNGNSLDTVVITKELKEYLSAFVQEGYLDQNYHWIRVKGHTVYHAGWMAKIITYNVPDVTYSRIERIIQLSGLIDAASKCMTQVKKTKIAEIEAVCTAHDLSKKTC